MRLKAAIKSAALTSVVPCKRFPESFRTSHIFPSVLFGYASNLQTYGNFSCWRGTRWYWVVFRLKAPGKPTAPRSVGPCKWFPESFRTKHMFPPGSLVVGTISRHMEILEAAVAPGGTGWF